MKTTETVMNKQQVRYRREARVRRLEYLRGEIKAERVSYDELVELESLVPFIEPDDVELLEWAGVREFRETEG